MCHLVHQMVLTSLVCTHRGIPYLEFHFLHSLEFLILNPMQYQLVELFMGRLAGYRRSLNLATEVLGLVVVVLLALLAVTCHISRTPSKLWVVLDLLLTSFENSNSQPSVGSPSSQAGLMTQVPAQGLSQAFRDGFSIGGMSQDFLGDDFKSQGSHVAYNVADFST